MFTQVNYDVRCAVLGTDFGKEYDAEIRAARYVDAFPESYTSAAFVTSQNLLLAVANRDADDLAAWAGAVRIFKDERRWYV